VQPNSCVVVHCSTGYTPAVARTGNEFQARVVSSLARRLRKYPWECR